MLKFKNYSRYILKSIKINFLANSKQLLALEILWLKGIYF